MSLSSKIKLVCEIAQSDVPSAFGYASQLADELWDSWEQNKRLSLRSRRLESALMHYADPMNWGSPYCHKDQFQNHNGDPAAPARQALCHKEGSVSEGRLEHAAAIVAMTAREYLRQHCQEHGGAVTLLASDPMPAPDLTCAVELSAIHQRTARDKTTSSTFAVVYVGTNPIKTGLDIGMKLAEAF